MNSRRKAYGAGKGSKRSNGLRVAPVTKAVRTALAFSALALATASPAFACDIVAPIPGDIVTCDDANYPGTIEYNVDDLTVVIGDGIGSTDVTPPSGDDGVELSGDGHLVVEVTSSASIYVEDADGVDIESYGSAEATNAGLIDVENGTGISVEAYYDANVVNSGHIDADGAYFNAGIRAYSAYGSADVVNNGSIASYSSNSAAVGIIAYADVGATVVNNSAVDVYAYGYAAGILAYSWDGTASIENAGDVTVVSNSYGSAVGVGAAGSEVSIFNTGGVESVALYGNAVGIEGYSTGNAVVDNEDYVYAGAYFDATAIDVYSLGDTTIGNDGAAYAYTYYYGDTIGIRGYSIDGDANLTNTGAAVATNNGYGGMAVGLYGYSAYGNTTIDNSGTAVGQMLGGYAGTSVGIFASGGDVTVTNTGLAVGYGGYWGAGIEAQGSDSVYVSNGGGAFAYGYGRYYAFGVYAEGGAGGAEIVNDGLAVAAGYNFAHALYAYSGGDTTVTNTGGAYGGNASFTGAGTGIHAASYGVGASVVVDNSGIAYGGGYYGGNGIAALATNDGSTVSVTNTGDVYAQQYSKYGYGAYGIVASGDGAAVVENSGFISSTSQGQAYGVAALSQSGDASVINQGDIIAESTYAGKYYGATGVLAASAAGYANVDNSGSVAGLSTGYYAGTGIHAIGQYGATVNNTGYVESFGKYSFGVQVESGLGDAVLNNSGSLYATGKYAYGALAYSAQGDAIINNIAGDAYVSGNAVGVGLFAVSVYGDAQVGNDADSSVLAYGSNFALGAYARTVYEATATLDNQGDIRAYAGIYGTAIGARVRSDGESFVNNSGSIQAYSDYTIGIQANGTGVTNIVNAAGGIIDVSGYYTAVGISSQMYGDVNLDTAGNIYADARNEYAFGIMADAYGGTGTISNTGLISATSLYGMAHGIVGMGDVVNVGNDGFVYAAASYATAAGIMLQADQDANVDLGAYSQIGAIGSKYAAGVAAFAYYGDVAVTSAAGGSMTSYADTVAAGIVGLSKYGDASIDNGGDIEAFGASGLGIQGSATYGTATVSNSGTIYAYGSTYSALGILAESYYGEAIVSNTGDVTVNAAGQTAYGLAADGNTSLVSNAGVVDVYGFMEATGMTAFAAVYAGIDNAGSVSVTAGTYAATGLYAYAHQVGGDAMIANSGDVVAYSPTTIAYGARAEVLDGNASIDNSGSLAAYGQTSVGAVAEATAVGNVAVISNSGSITSASITGNAFGAISVGMDSTINNSGDVFAEAGYLAVGAEVAGYYSAALNTTAGSSILASSAIDTAVGTIASAYAGSVTVNSAGDVRAETVSGRAYGMYLGGDISVDVTNSGIINASASDAAGSAKALFAYSIGDVTITNSGTISADHDNIAVAVQLYSADGTARVYNSGTIETSAAPGGSFAIVGHNQVDEVHNTGTINGHIQTGAGDDLLANGAGGTWNIIGSSSSFGDGADDISNAGTIVVASGTLYAGNGDDSLDNSGTLVLANGTVDLGDADAANTFVNTGTIQVLGNGSVEMGPVLGVLALGSTAGALANDGVISMVNGATDDVFTVNGSFGGSGAVQVDADLAGGTADQLYVNGDFVGSDAQAVDVAVTSMPTSLEFTPITFATVTGDASAESFTAGNVIGFEGELLDFGLAVLHSEVGTDNVFSLGLTLDGLSDGGVLAATVAPGVHSLVGTSVGTLRQRVGVLPTLDDMNGLGPWLRWFDSDGDVNPTGSGFAAGENLGFSQKSDGVEVGINFTVGHGFHYGVLLGQADGSRSLNGGIGRDRTDLDTAGVYATWLKGDFYFDASWRWMDFESRLRTATADYRTTGNARAFNFEAGYTGWQVGSMTLVPQIQYTRTTVDNMDPVMGELTEAALYGGVSERLRAGLGLEHSFTTAGGMRVTPYGALSAIHESDGRSGFVINGDPALSGRVEADGTSGLLELGVGLQTGGWSFTGGLNWTDGGAVDSNVGGQIVARYTW